MDFNLFILQSLAEDIGNGDHTSLATIDAKQEGTAVLKVKDDGILAGIKVAEAIMSAVNPEIKMILFFSDGDRIQQGDIVFEASGPLRDLLKAERLLLNCMQRMSGIATLTHQYVDAIKGTNAIILDTRKTTPLFRQLEKEAVVLGGGQNHRFGLYDMILIKDNHVDSAGGIKAAIERTKIYLQDTGLHLQVEIETRNPEEVKQVLETGFINRIMLDNFTPDLMKEAVKLIDGKYETEASGGITLDTVRAYAETGVDFISVGALTHSVKSLDLSFKVKLVH